MAPPLANAEGERLDGAFGLGREPLRREDWIVLLGHGVTGNKDRPVLVEAALALNAAGFDTLRFSFSGNGDSEGDFRASTITKEVADLGGVIDAVAGSYEKIAYLGHSMGAAAGVLRAAADERIRALVSVAGMVETRAFAEREFDGVTPDEGTMWEEPACPLSSAFWRDLRETVVSTAPSAAGINIPWLLVHGTADDIIPPGDSELIQRSAGGNAELVRVEGADHSFEQPRHMLAMTGAVVTWLRQVAEAG
ncbi:MAG: alpha/beta fold hydrolase [Verrucomicrobiota bacterium]